jgi:hypothetical protein
MRSTRLTPACLGVALLWAGASSFGQSLPGFTLTGENWSYDPGDGGSVITGILSRPPGSGPFPAALISHGQGGSAIGFALPNAHILTNWGLLCIGPDYTHVTSNDHVANSRILLDGVGHDLEHERSNEVFTAIHDWFGQWGVLGATNSPATNAAAQHRPRGLFVLDSSRGTLIGGVSMRDANVRSNAFLTGYVLRAPWQTLETSREVYNFTMVSNIVTRLQPLGQKLSLIIVPNDPPYLAATPGVTTWVDQDQSGNPLTRVVPWDPFLLQQRGKFLAALAACQIGGIALSNHPVLQVINPYLAGGFTGIRDPVTAQLRNLPGYSRSNLLYAVQSELRALTANFPAQFVQIGFWNVLDGENAAYGNTEAWEYLRRELLAEFDGAAHPHVGFFMENLAASRPAPGQDPITGYPVTAFGTALFLSQTNTWNGFQALTSWHQPFTGASKVANGTPADGMRFAFETYGATYFEIYVSDVDYAPYLSPLTDWQERLTTPAAQARLAPLPSDSGMTLTWDRASPVTSVEAATNLPGGFHTVSSVTNAFVWTNSVPFANPPRAFYRLSQQD